MLDERRILGGLGRGPQGVQRRESRKAVVEGGEEEEEEEEGTEEDEDEVDEDEEDDEDENMYDGNGDGDGVYQEVLLTRPLLVEMKLPHMHHT